MSIPSNASITRKRPREEEDNVEARQIDQRPFSIKHTSRPLAPPRTFRPLLLLPRAALPLAYLDTAPNGSQLFAAHLDTLETSYQCGSDPMILVAAETGEKNLCAVERVRKRCYALCKLRAGVTEARLVEDGRRIKNEAQCSRAVKRMTLEPLGISSSEPWWQEAAVCASTLPTPPPALRNLLMSVEVPESRVQPPSSPKVPSNLFAATTRPVNAISPGLPPQAEQTVECQNICEELSKHYLDALYLSRTSLAFFAKGPLSRARVSASFKSSNQNPIDLAAFLRQTILSSLVMDKKYREHLPKIIADLPVATPVQTTEKMKKKRSKWKPKRTKMGFFTNEHEFLQQWWQRDDEKGDTPSSAETMEEVIRQRCARLRNRETYLQIIIVLETLALEAAAAIDAHVEGQSVLANTDAPGTESRHREHDSNRANAKKALHLPTHLEALLDKLCIWQSLESSSPAKKRQDDAQSDNDSHDDLRNFCIEVVVPFFSSRIPEYAVVVNKKFGGPSAPPASTRTSSSARKATDTAKKKVPLKTVKPPARDAALDDESQGNSSRASSLHRKPSNSNSFRSIKREVSEVSMDSVPSLKSARAHGKSTSVIPSLHQFTKREVDLNAVSASTEAKIRKKRDVEARLKEAVETLKKPNRALAVKDDELRIDERFVKASTGKPKSRTSLTQARRKREGDNRRESQVNSTPSHSRTITATPYRPSHVGRVETTASNESKTTHVPSSTLRPGAMFAVSTVVSSPSVPRTAQRTRLATSIEETPSRGFAKFMPVGLAHPPGTLESPVVSRTFAMVQQSPSKPAMRPLVEASPNLSRTLSREAAERNASVYDTLGWDDDSYEQLD